VHKVHCINVIDVMAAGVDTWIVTIGKIDRNYHHKICHPQLAYDTK